MLLFFTYLLLLLFVEIVGIKNNNKKNRYPYLNNYQPLDFVKYNMQHLYKTQY